MCSIKVDLSLIFSVFKSFERFLICRFFRSGFDTHVFQIWRSGFDIHVFRYRADFGRLMGRLLKYNALERLPKSEGFLEVL